MVLDPLMQPNLLGMENKSNVEHYYVLQVEVEQFYMQEVIDS